MKLVNFLEAEGDLASHPMSLAAYDPSRPKYQPFPDNRHEQRT
jgi:hypothetical protein